METLLKGDWNTGVVYDPESDGCELRVAGQCVAWRKMSFACEREAQRRGIVLAAPTVAPVAAQERTENKVPAQAGQCCFVRSIRAFYACAQERGLNTKADADIRAAIGAYWGIEVKSRKQLSGGQWSALAW